MLRQRKLMLLTGLIALAAWSVTALAQQTTGHNPYTIPGVQIRANMVVPVPDGFGGYRNVSMGAAAFQEIEPCRLVSTLASDGFPAPFGGPAFGPNESRVYLGAGKLFSGEWINPCSEKIPLNAAAIAARLNVIDPQGTGTIYLTPGMDPVFNGIPVLPFLANTNATQEGGAMLRGSIFTVYADKAATDLTLDVLGYFIEDPLAKGEIGPRGPAGAAGATGAIGPTGAVGATGAQGIQGEVGPTGPQGVIGPTGAQGLQGATGATGAQGIQGEIGPTGLQGVIGPTGAQGLQGVTGATGAQGIQGEIGPTGPQGVIGPTGSQGEAGPQGIQGPIGPTGAAGENGAPGATGAIGPTGAQGASGPIGPTGPTGEQGAQGPAGAAGSAGPTGATGPTGPTGPAGAAGADGKAYLLAMGTGTFTSGSLTIYNAAIQTNSYVFLQYNHPGSPGNACSVESIGSGSVVVSGSTGKKFMYLVLTPYTP